jgi:hypothetical protein
MGYFFQQDGAPPHYANTVVTDVLNEQLLDKWIGRGGPLIWPPSSPDLYPLDIFSWGYIKDIVYQMHMEDNADLHRWLVTACETIMLEMLQNTCQDVKYHLDFCWATKDTHVQIYWKTTEMTSCICEWKPHVYLNLKKIYYFLISRNSEVWST